MHTEITVPIRDGNDVEVKVLVHTPKKIAGVKNNACIVYAHGGGVTSGSAEVRGRVLS